MTNTIRVVIVDDHPIVIAGVKSLIEDCNDIVCVGEAGCGAEALTIVAQTVPDVAILDISLPDINGLVLAEQIIAQGQATHVVIMTLHSDSTYVRQALQAGAKGFIQKCSASQNLLLAIRSVMAGGLFFDPPTARQMTSVASDRGATFSGLPHRPGLTAREQDVLRLVALGYSNKEIGARANISVKSIETYKARATEKLNLHSRAQIVHFALTHGWMRTH